jgi:serine/threonine-protein kinase
MTHPFAPGQILEDKYRIDSVIGEGGMGVVVAALHVQLQRRVAIKFLLPEMLRSTEVVARFQREARAAAMLESEHVTKVIDVGTTPDGTPFMVMELLTGEDLATLVERGGPLSADTAIAYILQACEAIAEAHRAGIVHRDLKPSNLFLAARNDGSSTIKVLDFGISKLQSTTASLALTQESAVMGSPTYMAPEQVKSAKSVNARADIWGLGVILYELLAGKTPFPGTEYHEVLAKVLLEPCPPLTAYRPDISPQLEAVVLRCLQKKPSDRFPTVMDFALALRPFVTDDLTRMSIDRVCRLAGVPAAASTTDTRSVHQPRPQTASNTFVALAATSPAVGTTSPRRIPRGIVFGVGAALLALVLAVGGLWMNWSTTSPPPGGVVPDGFSSSAVSGTSVRASRAPDDPVDAPAESQVLAASAAPTIIVVDPEPTQVASTTSHANQLPVPARSNPSGKSSSGKKSQSSKHPVVGETPPKTAKPATTSRKNPLDMDLK